MELNLLYHQLHYHRSVVWVNFVYVTDAQKNAQGRAKIYQVWPGCGSALLSFMPHLIVFGDINFNQTVEEWEALIDTREMGNPTATAREPWSESEASEGASHDFH